jgi:hypothetical protein
MTSQELRGAKDRLAAAATAAAASADTHAVSHSATNAEQATQGVETAPAAAEDHDDADLNAGADSEPVDLTTSFAAALAGSDATVIPASHGTLVMPALEAGGASGARRSRTSQIASMLAR